MRLAILAMGMLAIAAFPEQPATAQKPWDWAHCASQADFDILHPMIQDMLKNDEVGARRDWHSSSGRRGRIYLESGGERAGSSTAVVRITTRGKNHESLLFVFRYLKDPKRGWGVVG